MPPNLVVVVVVFPRNTVRKASDMASKPTGGFVEENEKERRWDCYVVIDDQKKHMGYASSEKGANSIVNSAIERRG
jgi:hypothetical protein